MYIKKKQVSDMSIVNDYRVFSLFPRIAFHVMPSRPAQLFINSVVKL